MSYRYLCHYKNKFLDCSHNYCGKYAKTIPPLPPQCAYVFNSGITI